LSYRLNISNIYQNSLKEHDSYTYCWLDNSCYQNVLKVHNTIFLQFKIIRVEIKNTKS